MSKLNKSDQSILIANLIDHFDTAIYSFLVPILAPILFPKFDPIVQIVLAYSLSVVSIITRPLGCIIFGKIASSQGPIYGLYYSLIGVAVTTTLTGLLPTYEVAGWYTTLLLVTIRSMKGVFAAGESAIAKLYILENKAYNTAFKSSYLYQSSSMLGIILASSFSTIVIHYQKYHNLWRICFLLGGSLGLVAGYIRRNYKNLGLNNNKTIFFSYKNLAKFKDITCEIPNLFRVAITTGLSHVTYSIPFTVMNNIIPYVTTISLSTMMTLNTSLLIIDLLLISIIGPIVSKYNYTKVMIIASLALGTIVPFLFCFIKGAGLVYITAVRVWIVFWGVVFMCPQNLYYKNLFPNQNQYFLVGIANAVGAATIGKFTPVFCIWAWHRSQNVWFVGVYVSIIAFMTFILLIKNKRAQ